MNEQKRSELYTPWGSLSMRNLVNRLSGGKGKQMLTDEDSLIVPGRHPRVLCRGLNEDPPELLSLCRWAGASVNRNILIKR